MNASPKQRLIADEMHPDERPHVVERCQTELGELVLRRCGNHHELISDGMFVMDTRDGRSERALLEQALAVAPPRPRVVIGGLGFGFSLEAAVASAAPASIVVVEVHRQIIEWNRAHLPERTSRTMADPRVRVVCADVGEWLDRTDGQLDVVCLDIDNGSGWSAERSPAFEGALRRSFGDVAAHEIPVARGAPDIVYVARHPL